MIVLFKLYGLYDRDVKRISHSTVDDIPWLFHATVIGGLLFWVYAKVSPMGRLDLQETLLFGVGVVVLVAVTRFAIRSAAARLVGTERVLLLGIGPMTQALARKVAQHPEYQLEVIGSLTPDVVAHNGNGGEFTVLGTIDELADVATKHGVGRVVMSAEDVADADLEDVLRRCRQLSLKFSMLPRLSDVLGSAVELDDVGGVTVLGVNPPWLPRTSRALKRALDIAISATILIVASPVLLVVAIAIRFDSPGPVLFGQERVGKGGQPFRLFKFRTMVRNAEELRAELVAQSADPNWLKLDHDPRITRLGGWLRRTSLDELPQLWNVLRGQMSMVGPRPLIPVEDERVLGWARGRLDLTPGLTGYWQVLGRTRIPFEEMVKLDYLYVMNWSLWEDIRLMLRTLPVVLGGRGAN
jgi:exopolysaccharide biosynthesis polyprenyl glycosylphosphotransferase